MKPVIWIGDSRRRLKTFPQQVRSEVGQAIYEAQLGGRSAFASALKGINAVEVISDYRGDTFRAAYTTRFAGRIYVLHCFQKKSRGGIKTPRHDLDLIRTRLSEAQILFDSEAR